MPLLIAKDPALSTKYWARYCSDLDFEGLQLFNILPICLIDLHAVDVSLKENWIPDEKNSRRANLMSGNTDESSGITSSIDQKPDI